MLIMWGALVFAGYLGSFLWPRQAGYFWLARRTPRASSGSFAISAFGYPQDAAFAPSICRMLIAFLLFFAFGFFCTSCARPLHAAPDGTFWPIYFMLLYIIAGLWFGHAFVVDRSSLSPR